jgi:hypothetical protein
MGSKVEATPPLNAPKEKPKKKMHNQIYSVKNTMHPSNKKVPCFLNMHYNTI